jgi:hypothetical protein
MAPHIRIADGLRTQTAEQLINTAGAIINRLTGNPSFPSPPVDLKTVQNFGVKPHNSIVNGITRFSQFLARRERLLSSAAG